MLHVVKVWHVAVMMKRQRCNSKTHLRTSAPSLLLKGIHRTSRDVFSPLRTWQIIICCAAHLIVNNDGVSALASFGVNGCWLGILLTNQLTLCWPSLDWTGGLD